MNNITSRQVCAAAKVSGCLLGLPLAVVGMIMVPYFSVIIGFAIILSLLWCNKVSLPKNLLETALLGVAGGIIPPLCGVMYWLTSDVKFNGSHHQIVDSNFSSILITIFLVFIFMATYCIVITLFDHFLKGCTDQKSTDNGTAPDSNIKETDASVLAK